VSTPQPGRPRPILDAVRGVGTVTALIGSLVTALVGVGVFNTAQGSAAQALLATVAAVIPAVTGLLVAFGVLRKAEPKVTPLSSPMDNQGRPLVAADWPRPK